MKLLRNSFLVGLLVVVAVVLIGVNIVWPMVKPLIRRGGGIPQIVSKAMMPASRPAGPSPKPVVVEVAPKLEGAAVRSNLERWVTQPKRDPFQGRIRPRDQQGAYPAAVELLSLNAVWRQSGGSLAVINGRICSVGGEILDFKVTDIEADHVWVQGPNGREVLGFRSEIPATTNPPSAGLENPEPVAPATAPSKEADSR
jgi:hypothetical protein